MTTEDFLTIIYTKSDDLKVTLSNILDYFNVLYRDEKYTEISDVFKKIDFEKIADNNYITTFFIASGTIQPLIRKIPKITKEVLEIETERISVAKKFRILYKGNEQKIELIEGIATKSNEQLIEQFILLGLKIKK